MTGLHFVIIVIAWNKKTWNKFMLTLLFFISQKWIHLYLSLINVVSKIKLFPPFFSSPNSNLSLTQSNYIVLHVHVRIIMFFSCRSKIDFLPLVNGYHYRKYHSAFSVKSRKNLTENAELCSDGYNPWLSSSITK